MIKNIISYIVKYIKDFNNYNKYNFKNIESCNLKNINDTNNTIINDIRCLTLKEPYATAIIENRKKIETRSWKTSYRGKILIHTSQKVEEEMLKTNVFKKMNKDITKGAIIGVADLVDCVEMTKDNIPKPNTDEYKWGIYSDGRYMLKLENIKKFDKPIQSKGKLNLWRPKDDLLVAIENQLNLKVKYDT